MSTILFTGASSFSGHAFVESLSSTKQHKLLTPLRGTIDQYSGTRLERINRLSRLTTVTENAPLGSNRFLSLLESQKSIDMFCLHHAAVGDYKSGTFDIAGAITQGTYKANLVASTLAEKGLQKVIVTRSVFESNLGVRSEQRAVSPYAIAKRAVSEIWHDVFNNLGIQVSDFVITNPFGAREEKRLVSYLVSNWKEGKTPELSSPHYIRDNIPIPLLAQAYALFAESGLDQDGVSLEEFTPSFSPITNEEFAQSVASRFNSLSGSNFTTSSAASPSTGEPLLLAGKTKITWQSLKEEGDFWQKYFDFYFKPKETS